MAEHDVEYEFGDSGVPEISSGASSYEDGNAVAQAFAELDTVLGGCTSVTGPDSDGNTWDMTVSTYDETASATPPTTRSTSPRPAPSSTRPGPSTS